MNRDRIVKLRDDLQKRNEAHERAYDNYTYGMNKAYSNVVDELDDLLEICDGCDGSGKIDRIEGGEMNCLECGGSGKVLTK